MKRLWKNYNKWEDYKNGFYSTKKKYTEEDIINTKNILCSNVFFRTALLLFDKWKNSIDHNLSYYESNRKSYLGQVACCYLLGFSSKTTAEIFTKFSIEEQKIANDIANKILDIYDNFYYEEQNEKIS